MLAPRSHIWKGSSLPDQTSHLNISHISGVRFGLSFMEKNLSEKARQYSRAVTKKIDLSINCSFSPLFRNRCYYVRFAQIFD